ncbi:MAG TPA: ABC transporter permease subunit [Steroidobacteraceae bacterium]|nr:ABC transporter permease subunit [Steroidobacteraceae bacterium]
MPQTSTAWTTASRGAPSRFDLIALLLVIGLLAFLAEASRGVLAPLATIQASPVSLAPAHLPEYAARTTLRMIAAMVLSLLFTFTYATWAAKSPRASRILVPLLDVLQSVPILGFISVTVVFFLSLAPGRVLGAEFAAIFGIFTSQAWNMAFSFYQSLRTVPVELEEAARSFRLSAWARFWRLEVPFAMPPLVWNMMMSMSGGWFFVVASEAISVGSTTVTLPGMGAYIALAIEHKSLAAVGWAIATMLVVIVIYDQLLFRPLVAWSDRFRFEQEPGAIAPRSWVLEAVGGSMLVARVLRGLRRSWRTVGAAFKPPAGLPHFETAAHARRLDRLATAIVAALLALAVWQAIKFLAPELGWRDIGETVALGAITMLRVFVLIALASVVWVPIGMWIGLRPEVARIVQPIAQFMAAFPTNLLFPIVVFGIVSWRLNQDIWLSPLMILGTQWYILFNVIAGAAAMPGEMRLVAQNLGVDGWLWWRRVALPAVFPFYVTGALTASGGSWNASIVAEVASWGDQHVEAMGLGAYIANATTAGDFHRIALGVVTMSVYVLLINRLLWRPLYYYAERKFRLS